VLNGTELLVRFWKASYYGCEVIGQKNFFLFFFGRGSCP